MRHNGSVHKLQTALALTCMLSTVAAQIPNGGFENWVNVGGTLEPVGWLTYNDVPTVGGATVEQGLPGNPGSYHAVITSRAAMGGGLPIQGWVSAGTSGTNDGFPNTSRPAMLTGQWQYGIQPNDTGQVIVALSKWNSMTSSTDLIAFGSLEVTGSQGTWQSFSVPLSYSSSDTPDTAYIQIVSSINFGSPVAGSFMKVDDLAFSGTVGVYEAISPAPLAVFPNPGKDLITLTLPPGPHTITLFDATGRMVLQQRTTDERTVIGTEQLPAGLYRITMRDEQGATMGATWVKER
ncbi:MAG: T9SS type A sorting domain-containing protein [Flavobacteriales bacterium]|nr:T9SS type A sorting domain-containing protein [Flavobacteriales bacterium]